MNKEAFRERFFLPGLLLILVVLVITSTFGLYESYESSKTLANEFVLKTTNEVNNKITLYLNPGLTANLEIMDYLKVHPESNKDYLNLEKIGMELLKRYPNLSAFNIGYENGNFFRLFINDSNLFEEKIIYKEDDNPHIEIRYFDSHHNFEHSERIAIDDYDPRIRPWYIGAKEKEGTYWSKAYQFYTDQKPGITVGTPIWNEEEFIGVYSFDLKIKSIEDYIRSIEVSENGVAILVNYQNDLLTFSSENYNYDVDNQIIPYDINKIDDVILNEAYKFVDDELYTLHQFEANHNRYYVMFSDLSSVEHDSWKIGLIAPEKDFMQSFLIIKNTTIITIFFIIILIVLLNYYRYSEKRIKSYLIEHSQKDPLTGLLNRRSTHKIYNLMMDKKSGKNLPVGVLLGDIDHFKRINDSYGHNFGDKVLKVVAELLKDNLRESDLICRWGGEEFLIVLSTTDETQLKLIGEKLRNKIEQHPIKTEHKDIFITMSFGGYAIVNVEDLEKAVSFADRMLYTAKEHGRNRVVIQDEKPISI